MRKTSTRRSRRINRKRPQLMCTIAPDVHEELHRRAAELGIPVGRVVDAGARIAFGLPSPASP